MLGAERTSMKYIMCAKTYPVFHPKAGRPTGFRESILNGRKIHTLRQSAGNRQTGDIVSLREWGGRPYASKQVEFARCRVIVDPLTIDGVLADDWELGNIARCDGFADPQDFAHWFTKGKPGPVHFDGVCIYFRDVSPNAGVDRQKVG